MSEGKPGRSSDQFALRLPDGMRDRIKAAADRNGRSMNAEIVHRLELSIGLFDYNPEPPRLDFLVEHDPEGEHLRSVINGAVEQAIAQVLRETRKMEPKK